VGYRQQPKKHTFVLILVATYNPNCAMPFFTRLRYIFLLLLIFICGATVANNDPLYLQRERCTFDSLKQELNTQILTEKQKMQHFLHIGYLSQNFDLDTSILYLTKGISLAKKLKDDEMLIEFYAILGINFCFKGDADTAFHYFNQLKELAIKHGKKDKELSATLLTGYAYAKQGNFHTALDFYLKGLKIYENEGWTKEHGYVSNLANISEINRRLGNTETAIYYLKKAEKVCNEQEIPIWNAAQVWNELAFNYLKQDSLDKALLYALKADVVEYWCGTVNRCYTKGLLATIHLKQNNLDHALQFAKEAYEQANTLKDISLYAYSGKILSDIYLAQKRYPEAEAEALKVLESCATYIDESLALIENIALANIYMGNTEKAAYYLKKYSEQNAQYVEKSFHTTVSDLAIKYETEKKELRIATLEKDKRFYTGLTISGVAILLLVILLLLVRQRIIVQKRKLLEQQHEIAKQQVKQLEQEKQLIATQAALDGETAERSRLARDLHDGLGGMLSVVKLNLKDMKQFVIMDGSDVERFGSALALLDDSIGELRRVAHHIMPESLMRCGLKIALEDFCNSIQHAHFQYIGNETRLDNRLEVLIYRAAHELINNAIKYAQATAINVQLLIDEGIISLTVQDNGIGFDPKTTHLGMGLENIKTRLAMYNGKMNIHSSSNSGTEICIEIEQL